MLTDARTKKISVAQTGAPDVLQLTEESTTDPGPDQIEVEVSAAGVNYLDIYQRRGDHPVASGFPWVPGFEGFGVVRRAHATASRWKIGDRVAWIDAAGSYTNTHHLDQANAFSSDLEWPLFFQAVTAQYLLHDYRTIRPGENVLVHAAAGGVGSIAVRWAKKLGANVIGTVSSEAKRKLVLDAGADAVFVHDTLDFVKGIMDFTKGVGAHLVLDSIGRGSLERSIQAAAVDGTVINYGFANGAPEPVSVLALYERSVRLTAGELFRHISDQPTLQRRADAVSAEVRSGTFSLTPARTFPLTDAPAAHHWLEGRQSTGKVALVMKS